MGTARTWLAAAWLLAGVAHMPGRPKGGLRRAALPSQHQGTAGSGRALRRVCSVAGLRASKPGLQALANGGWQRLVGERRPQGWPAAVPIAGGAGMSPRRLQALHVSISREHHVALLDSNCIGRAPASLLSPVEEITSAFASAAAPSAGLDGQGRLHRLPPLPPAGTQQLERADERAACCRPELYSTSAQAEEGG